MGKTKLKRKREKVVDGALLREVVIIAFVDTARNGSLVSRYKYKNNRSGSETNKVCV